MYDDILFPADGSPAAEKAVDHVVHLAKQNDATVHAIHVVEVMDLDELTDDESGGGTKVGETPGEIPESIHDALASAGVDVVEVIREGRPHDVIAEYVEDEDVDLVVMGTHGKQGLSRVLLGSTAEKVVRHSSAPVLTVRERKD